MPLWIPLRRRRVRVCYGVDGNAHHTSAAAVGCLDINDSPSAQLWTRSGQLLLAAAGTASWHAPNVGERSAFICLSLKPNPCRSRDDVRRWWASVAWGGHKYIDCMSYLASELHRCAGIRSSRQAWRPASRALVCCCCRFRNAWSRFASSNNMQRHRWTLCMIAYVHTSVRERKPSGTSVAWLAALSRNSQSPPASSSYDIAATVRAARPANVVSVHALPTRDCGTATTLTHPAGHLRCSASRAGRALPVITRASCAKLSSQLSTEGSLPWTGGCRAAHMKPKLTLLRLLPTGS